MNYCYARVSTKIQNLDRQIDAFKNFEPYILYTDKESGKNFDRKNYEKMRKKVKEGDSIIVLSLDRFGRNYDQIKNEWHYFSNKGVKIKIIDMPLIDTTSNELTSKLISDIVLQLLSYVAEMEFKSIHARQAEGIKLAKEKGVKFGRPRAKISDFHKIATSYCNNEITNEKACELLRISRGTFFRRLKELGYKKEKKKLTNTRYI